MIRHVESHAGLQHPALEKSDEPKEARDKDKQSCSSVHAADSVTSAAVVPAWIASALKRSCPSHFLTCVAPHPTVRSVELHILIIENMAAAMATF
jgi:hypothetical protein